MSMIEAAVLGSKKVEGILKDKFQAEGKGLHEYLTSVESRIPADILKQARYIASVRNKVVHEDGAIDDIPAFNNTVEEVISGLERVIFLEEKEAAALLQRESVEAQTVAMPTGINENSSSGTSKILLVIFGLVTVFCLIAYINIKQDLDRSRQSNSSIKSLYERSKKRAFKLEDQVSKLEKDIKTKDKVIALLKTMHANAAKENDKLLAKLQTDSNNTEQQTSAPASPVSSGNALLAKAMKSGSEFDQAKAQIQEGFAQTIKSNMSLSTGDLEVSQESQGTYSVRVPVSWSISPKAPLQVLNKYFNSYKGKPISLSSDHMKRDKDRIVVSQRYADSSSSPRPYSGRLFDILQGVEIRLVASIGNKSGFITIAGNGSCHVSCSYSTKPDDSWLVLINGAPGEDTLSYKQESPIVIKGLTKDELKEFGEPVVKVIQI